MLVCSVRQQMIKQLSKRSGVGFLNLPSDFTINERVYKVRFLRNELPLLTCAF